MHSGVPRLFRRGNLNQEAEPENVTNLIEIMPIPSRRDPRQLTNQNDPIVNMLNKVSLCLLKFLTCSLPNYPAPGFSQ